VAQYVADLAGQLALMAGEAALPQTAAALMRAQLSALADLRQFANATADDDAA
jgi:hypothetical protein